MTQPIAEADRDTLNFFLTAQRHSVLAIVDGLTEEQVTLRVTPSAWTIGALIEHLGDAERVWFHHVVGGERVDFLDDDPSDADPEPGLGPDAATSGFRPVVEPGSAVRYYREQIARSDVILAMSALDARPAVPARVDIGITDDVMTVRHVMLHMIEETARHAGHLDIARETIDGRTGLGPR